MDVSLRCSHSGGYLRKKSKKTNMNIKSITTAFLSVVLSVSSLSARDVMLKFTTITPGSGSQLQLKSGEKVSIPKRYPSASYRVSVSPKGIVHLFEENADLESDEVKPICSFTVPKNLKVGNVLLVEGKVKGRYRGKVLDYAEFKGGGVCFYNASTEHIGALIGNDKVKISPNQLKLYNPSSSSERDVDARLATLHKQGKVKNVFHRGQWHLTPTMREVMVMYYHPVAKSIKIRGIVDY